MHRRSFGLAAAAVVAGAGLTATARAQGAPTMLDIVNRSRDFQRFAELVRRAGVAAQLSAPGNFGLFAPTDQAFLTAPPARLEAATANPDALRRLVLNHLTPFGEMFLPGGDMNMGSAASTSVRSAGGDAVFIMQSGSGLPSVNGLRLFVTNLRASNGYVHAIDGILFP